MSKKEAEKQTKPKADPKTAKVAGSGRSKYLALAVVLILAIASIYFLYLAALNSVGVSFSSFKYNFNAATRGAVAVTYTNNTQSVSESKCYTVLMQVLGSHRNPSTIDFLLMNQTTCQYSPTGLGHAINVVTANASSCIKVALSEPSIFLNFSNTNGTQVYPYHLYIKGNDNYMSSCPLAVGLN